VNTPFVYLYKNGRGKFSISFSLHRLILHHVIFLFLSVVAVQFSSRPFPAYPINSPMGIFISCTLISLVQPPFPWPLVYPHVSSPRQTWKSHEAAGFRFSSYLAPSPCISRALCLCHSWLTSTKHAPTRQHYCCLWQKSLDQHCLTPTRLSLPSFNLQPPLLYRTFSSPHSTGAWNQPQVSSSQSVGAT
jgi:hypothetical protein